VDTRILRVLLPCLLSASTALAEEAAGPPVEQSDVAALFDERGVLTPRGALVLEPGLTYSHSTTTQVAIEGYTVIPSVLVGLINVSEVQRDTLTAALATRYGLTSRFEVELKVPYVYKDEQVREREANTGQPNDIVRSSDGMGLGDVELALRYQLNDGRDGWPYLVAGLRVKSRTGEDPFEVERETLFVEGEGGNQVPIGEVFKEQPTGSGFWGVQPSLGFIYTSDPAVLFANISYLWNVERDVGGEFGRIDPGDAIGFSFGMGFAINARTSFNLGYDHSTVLETKRENDAGLEASFDRFQIGTLLLGFSHRLGKRSSANLSLGIGVTEYAPDLQLSLRVPMTL
jgi:hypothetical protein